MVGSSVTAYSRWFGLSNDFKPVTGNACHFLYDIIIDTTSLYDITLWRTPPQRTIHIIDDYNAPSREGDVTAPYELELGGWVNIEQFVFASPFRPGPSIHILRNPVN